jgi:hypothetical protein
MGYKPDAWGSFPGRGKIFTLPHSAEEGSGTYSASYLMGTATLSLGVKRPEH